MPACLSFFKINFESIRSTLEFANELSMADLLSILRSDDLMVESEESVFLAVGAWFSQNEQAQEVSPTDGISSRPQCWTSVIVIALSSLK